MPQHDISQRIAILRFIMIFGVVLLHTPLYVDIGSVGNDWFSLTKAFFQSAVFRTTTPVLAMISAYLLFNARLDTQLAKLARKKTRTLVVPFLVFNTLMACVVYFWQSHMPLIISYQLYPFQTQEFLNAAIGLAQPPINYPLNFLRDLIVLTALAPLIGLVLRHAPYLGLVAISVIIFTDADGLLILRQSMAIMFYIGGLAATQKWNLRAFDRFAVPCLAAFCMACAYIVWQRVESTLLLRMVAPWLIWPATVYLVGTRLGRWITSLSRYSFFIFLAHAPILLLTWKIYRRAFGFVAYPLYWIAAPLVTVYALILIYRFCMAFLPSEFSAVIGAKAPPGAERLGAFGLARRLMS